MKKDYYVNEIEKVASRAWKRNLHNLTNDGINKLIDSNILNRKKELAGLKEGNVNLLKRFRPKQHKKINNFNFSATKDMDPSSAMQFSVSAKSLAGNKIPMMSTSATGRRDFYYPKGGNKNFTKSTNQLIDNHNKNLVGVPKSLHLQKLKKAKGESNKWESAITLRHELDEIRATNKIKPSDYYDKKRNPDGLSTRVGTHVSPEVLLREKANLGVAPKEVKDKFHRLRGELFNELPSVDSQISAKTRETIPSFNGNYSPSKAKKVVNEYKSKNKKEYRELTKNWY